jgi:hypothetical protein
MQQFMPLPTTVKNPHPPRTIPVIASPAARSSDLTRIMVAMPAILPCRIGCGVGHPHTTRSPKSLRLQSLLPVRIPTGHCRSGNGGDATSMCTHLTVRAHRYTLARALISIELYTRGLYLSVCPGTFVQCLVHAHMHRSRRQGRVRARRLPTPFFCVELSYRPVSDAL